MEHLERIDFDRIPRAALDMTPKGKQDSERSGKSMNRGSNMLTA